MLLALKIYGNAGADLIGVTGASISGAATTGQIIDGGAGHDTIKMIAFAASTDALTITGGAGDDSSTSVTTPPNLPSLSSVAKALT